jgi:hypothetical protein
MSKGWTGLSLILAPMHSASSSVIGVWELDALMAEALAIEGLVLCFADTSL